MDHQDMTQSCGIVMTSRSDVPCLSLCCCGTLGQLVLRLSKLTPLCKPRHGDQLHS